MRTSSNIRGLEPSATMAVTSLARELRAQGRDIIDLSAGEPDFPTPQFIADAGVAAIRDGFTRYTAPAGMPALREAIAATLTRETGIETDPAGVVVTAGAKQALFNACFALFGPGDRVLVPSPYWTSYPALTTLARADFVPVPGDPANGFKVSPVHLDRAVDARTRGLILNSPSNPTGAVYSAAELEALAAWAAEREAWLISDEIYAGLYYQGDRAPSVLPLQDALQDRMVLVDGASKGFAMTGWRIGFSYSVPELAGHMAALQSHITSNATTPAQHAALAAYRATAEQANAMTAMKRAFHDRRDLLLRLVEEHLPDADVVRPDGAFYLFVRVDGYYDGAAPDSVAFCRRLLSEAGVAVVPGEAFGDDRYVRVSFAASDTALEEGVRRIAGAVVARQSARMA